MDKMRKVITIMLICCLWAASVSVAFAVEFTDLQQAPWAQTHIQRMAEKGVVSGSTDAATGRRVYRPNSPVTKVESMVMLYSVMQKTNQLSSATDYSAKYQTMLGSAKIPQWAHTQVAYGLETGIILTSDLTGFMGLQTEPVQSAASREEVAIFFGRAVEKIDNGTTGGSLAFRDAEQISATAMPHVTRLVGMGIISGDNENRFNPRATITRAEMAALLSKTYDVMIKKDDNIVVTLPVIPVESEKDRETGTDQRVTRREGTIRRVNYDSRTLIVELEDKDQPEILEVVDSTKIFINSIEQKLDNLKAGVKGEFTYDDGYRLTRVDINPRRNLFTGNLRTFTRLADEYAIVVESVSSSQDRRSFRITDGTQVIWDDKVIPVRQLADKVDERMTIRFEGVDVISIENESARSRKEVDGILEGSVVFSRYPYVIRLRQLNRAVEEFEVDADARVTVDGKRGYLEELRRGDIVTLRFDNKGELVSHIDATSFDKKRKVEGRVEEIRLARPNQITIYTDERERDTYDLAEGVLIYIDRQRSDLSDLSVGTQVTLHFEGDRVIEIEADKVASGDQTLTGTIVRFHDNVNRLVVNYKNPRSDRYQDISVYISSRTVILDRSNKEVSSRHLSRDDEVLVRGYYENDDFIADRIIILD